MSEPSPVVCRLIEEADLAGVADCLVRNFPLRRREYWLAGLARLKQRERNGDDPRFGRMLEVDGAVVGVLLLIYSRREGGDGPFARCNFSSLCVDRPFRAYSFLLEKQSLARKDATFTNLSPAPHTLRNIDGLGFRRYARGQIVFAPLLARGARGARVTRYCEDAPLAARLGAIERKMLADHRAWGCVSLVGLVGERVEPLVLMPRRILRNLIPCMHVIYARDLDALAEFAPAIGRRLGLRAPFLVVDADAPHATLGGKFLSEREPRYFKGSRAPAPTDLAYSELAILGR
jgi:hypothetical protein